MNVRQRALISVFDKTGIIDMAQALLAAGFELLSTGGTAKLLRDQGLAVTDVADVTGQAEIMGGRVKSLHPKIHGGILARLDNQGDQEEMARDAIVPITMVVANLYPFEQQWQKTPDADLVEWIDIGGPTMIRAAAKNHAYVSVVTDPEDYVQVCAELNGQGVVSDRMRLTLAQKAFRLTASYDAAVSNWIQGQGSEDLSVFSAPERFTMSGKLVQELRYGENPHQQAAAYKSTNPDAPKGVMSAQQIQGKALSYNNFNDADAALRLVREFVDPACVIVKHANPCGVALGDDLHQAYQAAKSCDPVSAFGGVIAVNRPLDGAVATAITELFTEVVIAPDADEAARAVFAQKPNLRLLLVGDGKTASTSDRFIKALSDGFLVQDWDKQSPAGQDMSVVTKRKPSTVEANNLVFAQSIAKHVASNAIVLVKNGQTIGIGAGQMSRIDALRIALWKAEDAGMDVQGAALASDAFFPFPDVIETAASHGVTHVIHPGGSIKDSKVVDAADALDLAMVTTGIRHFRH